jgi:hypothetical protein
VTTFRSGCAVVCDGLTSRTSGRGQLPDGSPVFGFRAFPTIETANEPRRSWTAFNSRDRVAMLGFGERVPEGFDSWSCVI